MTGAPETIRQVGHAAWMDRTASDVRTEVPAAIQSAERWRVAGEKLRKNSPEVFEKLLAMLAASVLSQDDDEVLSITESYLLT